MTETINISVPLITEARQCGEVSGRTPSEQIEHWANIGKIVEDNPDLPYKFIKEVLAAKVDKLTAFTFIRD